MELPLTLSHFSGLFYVLFGGLSLALIVALVEFLRKGREEASRANITLKEALTAKSHVPTYIEHKSTEQRVEHHEQEPVPWNGVFTGVLNLLSIELSRL